MTTRIVIINPSRIERELIVRTFNASKNFDAIGCPNVKDALAIFMETMADVVIAPMTDCNIFSAAKNIASMEHGTIVVASGFELSPDSVIRCAQAGISGYIELEASADEWVTTVTAAMNGEVDNPKIAGMLLKYLAQETTHTLRKSWRVADDVAQSAKRVGLTPRERQIVGLIDKGLSNKAIANELHVESSTVKNHVHAILQKYGVRHRGEAAARFRETAYRNRAS